MKTRLIVVLLGFLGSGMFVACRDDASDKDDDRLMLLLIQSRKTVHIHLKVFVEQV